MWRQWTWWAGLFVFFAGAACAGPQYTENMAEHSARQAEYVESFAASPEEVERAVRRTLGDQNFDVVGGQSSDGASRFVRGGTVNSGPNSPTGHRSSFGRTKSVPE